MKTNLKGRDFISLKDYCKEDMETILDLAFELKVKIASGQPTPLLAGKNLGLLFCTASTRTRISFETAMSQLGGHAQYYAPEHLQLGAVGETWVDTAEVMSRYLDGLVVRIVKVPQLGELKYGETRQILNTIADHAAIPVLSAADDQEHPCQVMADVMTLIEKFGTDYKQKKLALVWVCNRRGVTPGIAQSMAIAAGTLGMRLTLAHPEGYDLDPNYINHAKSLAKDSGGTIEIVHNIEDAVKDASVIYSKGWGAIGKTVAEDLKIREPLVHWCIRKEHFDQAKQEAVFMNAMPLERERDATSDVVDGPRSIIYDQAENRLHAQKAIMSLIMR